MDKYANEAIKFHCLDVPLLVINPVCWITAVFVHNDGFFAMLFWLWNFILFRVPWLVFVQQDSV
jgi:hypothetical protein